MSKINRESLQVVAVHVIKGLNKEMDLLDAKAEGVLLFLTELDTLMKVGVNQEGEDEDDRGEGDESNSSEDEEEEAAENTP